MAETILSIEKGTIDIEGEFININDTTPWSMELNRNKYALFMHASVTSQSTQVAVDNTLPLSSNTWTIPTEVDGEFQFTLYGFLKDDDIAELVDEEVRYFVTDAVFKKYNLSNNSWSIADISVNLPKAVVNSPVLKLPILFKALIYKSRLLLKYVQTSNNLISKGTQQNILFYERNALDYFNALLYGAQYCYALGAISEFNIAVNNMTKFRLSNTA